MQSNEAAIGNPNGFHLTVGHASFSDDKCWDITIWPGNHGTSVPPEIRDRDKAIAIAQYLYDALLPEYIAKQERLAKLHDALAKEMATRPKPKPVRVPKNAPKIDVLECSECNALILPEDVSDERVYECGECGTKGIGEDGRRCDQCNKFTAKVSDTSCPECEAMMDDAETVQAQRATNNELVKVEITNNRAKQ